MGASVHCSIQEFTEISVCPVPGTEPEPREGGGGSILYITGWRTSLLGKDSVSPPTFLDVSELQHVEQVSRRMGWSEWQSQSPLVDVTCG